MLAPILIALEALATGETCPAQVDVEARVRSILHLGPERSLSESFEVERREAGLYVVLRAADSSVIGERTLPIDGSCDELAQAAAVVLSAWLSDVHPDFAGALPPPDEPEPAPPPPPEESPPVPRPRVLPVAPRAPPPAPPSRTRRWEGGIALGSDFTSQRFALAGALGGGYVLSSAASG